MVAAETAIVWDAHLRSAICMSGIESLNGTREGYRPSTTRAGSRPISRPSKKVARRSKPQRQPPGRLANPPGFDGSTESMRSSSSRRRGDREPVVNSRSDRLPGACRDTKAGPTWYSRRRKPDLAPRRGGLLASVIGGGPARQWSSAERCARARWPTRAGPAGQGVRASHGPAERERFERCGGSLAREADAARGRVRQDPFGRARPQSRLALGDPASQADARVPGAGDRALAAQARRIE